MRKVAAFGFLALTCGTTAASAQGYGGGFIELLMTGRDPTPYVRPVRPFAGQAADVYGRTRVAALPGAPLRDEVGVGRIIDPKYRRQTVSYDGPHAAGTIVIDTPAISSTSSKPTARRCATGSASAARASNGQE